MKRSMVFVFLCYMLSLIGCSIRVETEETFPIERRGFIRNVREIVKGNMKLRSRPIRQGENFSAFLAGTPSFPYKNEPKLIVLLPSGCMIDFDDNPVRTLLSVKESQTADFPFFDIGGGNMDKLYAQWPTGTQYVQIDGCNFYFKDDKVISFLVHNKGYDGNNQQILIKRKGTFAFFEFPLTQSQVISLIGRPDKITEYLEE